MLAASRVDQISLVGADDDRSGSDRRRLHLEQMWARWRRRADLRGVPLRRAHGRPARPVAASAYQPADGVTYPQDWPVTGLSDALEDTAHLIKADVGTDVVSIDFGSWDMHSDYGTTTEWGRMQSITAGLAGVIDAFMRDLGPPFAAGSPWSRAASSAAGSRRTATAGGTYYGQWPGPGDRNQADADLAVTTDCRKLFAEIITRRFPDRSVAGVFPLSYAPVGLMS